MIAVVLCLSLLVLCLTKYILHVRKIDKYLKNVKTLPRLPLIGNFNFFLGKSIQVLFEDLCDNLLRFGTPFKIQLGPTFFVILDHPDDMKTVLTSQHCLDKPYIYDFFHQPFSMLTQRSGKLWKPIRKFMNPMFNLKTLQSFIPNLNEAALMFVHKLQDEVNKPHFDVMHHSSVCTLNALCSAFMGIDLNKQPNQGLDFLSSLEGLYDVWTKRYAAPLTHSEMIYQLTNMYKTERKHLATMRNLTNGVIDAYSVMNNNTLKDDDCDVKKKSDFSLIPLCIEGKLDEEEAKQQIDIFLIAGHETSASTIAFAILMLAMHPKIQEQVFKELHTIYETQDQETTYEQIQRFEVLDRVIRETLRLFPVAFAFTRTPTVDIPLRNCVIPKGVVIALPVYTLHRRRDIWGDNAEQFDPDHFLPENVQKRHPYAYLPFSGGPRNCIGYQYAMFKMKVMLSAVLRQYKFSSNLIMSELRPKFDVTMRLSNKHMVKIEQRVW